MPEEKVQVKRLDCRRHRGDISMGPVSETQFSSQRDNFQQYECIHGIKVRPELTANSWQPLTIACEFHCT